MSLCFSLVCSVGGRTLAAPCPAPQPQQRPGWLKYAKLLVICLLQFSIQLKFFNSLSLIFLSRLIMETQTKHSGLFLNFSPKVKVTMTAKETFDTFLAEVSLEEHAIA